MVSFADLKPHVATINFLIGVCSGQLKLATVLEFFGNCAIFLILDKGAEVLALIVQEDVALALFQFLNYFPFSAVLSFVAMLMVIVFLSPLRIPGLWWLIF